MQAFSTSLWGALLLGVVVHSTPVLFIDDTLFAASHLVQMTVNKPTKGPVIIAPTEPWESWAVFGYNHVMLFNGTDRRMYYVCAHRFARDCIEANSAGKIGPRRVCLATSTDGITWKKPTLGLYSRNGSVANNIIADCSGVSVFIDEAQGVPSSERVKMVCDNSVWAGPDGLRFAPMYNHSSIHHADDTKDTATYNVSSGRYVVYVRRDIQVNNKSSGVVRWIGRCETDDLSNWEKETPAGCPTIFGPDAVDPDNLDVYTNSYTAYEGVHLFFPSFYHHFGHNPNGFGNDGLLDIRLVVSRDGQVIGYPPAANARMPFVDLGINMCGDLSQHPASPGGWCNPASAAVMQATAVDTSAVYMASGYLPSLDERSVFLYHSAQSFTHGQDAMGKTWGNNSGIRLLQLRKHGFVSVDAPYIFNVPDDELPGFTTVSLPLPENCPPARTNTTITNGCAYAQPSGKCSAFFACKSDADCLAEIPACRHEDPPHCTCKGQEIGCNQSRGVCSSPTAGGDVCKLESNVTVGGIGLYVNAQTAVAGFVRLGIKGSQNHLVGSSNAVRGNALSALASWGSGTTSLPVGARTVQVQVVMAAAKLFSLEFRCIG